MIDALKKLSPYKDEADRAPARPMSRWVRRALALAAAAAFAWPLLGLLTLQVGGHLPDRELQSMLACALVSTMIVVLLKIDLVGRVERRTRKKKEEAQ